MKRLFISVLAATVCVSVASAYNPPVGGEGVSELASPWLLSGTSSVAGGALFSAGPDALIYNPSVSAKEQRIVLTADYTALFSTASDNANYYGNVFQTGILIPMKWGILSGLVNGTFIPLDELTLGNSINIKAGLSKEITNALDVGVGVDGGFLWGAGSDWAVSGNLGFNYKLGQLGFLQDFRFGASVMHLGKNFVGSSLSGLDADSDSTEFPQLATFKAGAAGTLLSTDVLKLGLSLDLTTPLFQNLITDIGLQCTIKDKLRISIAEKLNIRELANNHVNVIPAIGVFYTFTFNVKDNDYLARNDWAESEMTIGGAYKNMYGTVNAISGGVKIDLGMQDTTPPVIKLWADEDDDEEE